MSSRIVRAQLAPHRPWSLSVPETSEEGFVWESSEELTKVTEQALVALPGREGAHWGSSGVC